MMQQIIPSIEERRLGPKIHAGIVEMSTGVLRMDRESARVAEVRLREQSGKSTFAGDCEACRVRSVLQRGSLLHNEVVQIHETARGPSVLLAAHPYLDGVLS